MTHTIGFTGDVMLGRKVDERQRRRDASAVWGDVLPRLRALDGLFVNLECCLSTRGDPYTGTYHPFHFRADPDWAIPALKAAGVDWASLANNHVLDYGEDAMLDTLQALDAAGIVHSGAGRDVDEAFDPAGVPVDDLDVAVVSFTDNVEEWAAGPDTPGVAHVRIDRGSPDVRETVRSALDAARAHDPDLVVASLHWGPNMTEGPDRARREFGRWLLGEGVDLVHGHSAHAFHGVEVVGAGDVDSDGEADSGGNGGGNGDVDADGGVILYDTGDFVDDYAVDPDLQNDRGFLFVVDVAEGGEIERLRLEPIRIDDYAVHAAEGRVAEWCRETVRERTERFDLGTRYERVGEDLVVEME